MCFSDDESLRKQLDDRRQVAVEREANVKEANALFDEDGIVEKLFNSLTGTQCPDYFALAHESVKPGSQCWSLHSVMSIFDARDAMQAPVS